MKIVTNLFQGKSASLEGGAPKYPSSNEYLLLNRDESRTNCGKFLQIVKVILYIELIIVIGWLGYVSLSYYNTDRNTDCGVSAIGFQSSKNAYDNTKVEHSRSGRSIKTTEDGREKCEKNANATRRGLDSLAAQFVTGELSDPNVLQLRQNFTELTIYVSMHMVNGFVAVALAFDELKEQTSKWEGFSMIDIADTKFITTMPNDDWHKLVETLIEKFVNSTDSQNRQRLKLHDPPIEEMANELRTITESLYIDVRECDRRFADSFSSVRKYNETAKAARRWNRELDPVSQLTIDCRDAEAQLLKDRRERLEAFAADVASGRYIGSDTRNFLKMIQSALNAMSPSEVTVEDVWLHEETGLREWKRFVSNASLELKKEFYELVRDEYLENRNANHDSPDWEGYDTYWSYRNWTNGLSILLESESPRVALDLTIKYGKVYNLRYVEAEREDSSVDSQAPAFGTFINLDSESETLGVRRMRHILDGFVRLYFRVINRLGPCKPAAGETLTRDRRFVKKRFVTGDPIQKRSTATCWNEEEDMVLAEERLERLAAYAFRLKKKEADASYRKAFLRGIEAALNATSISEIHFEHDSRKWPWLTYVESLSENSSLEARKEGYALIRDLYLELYELKNHHPEWNGYNLDRIVDNLTASNFFSVDFTKVALFSDIVKYSNVFNLRYVVHGNRESGAEPNKPVFGKFTYVGEEPEKLGIRQLRHILDALVKFYFKTQDSSSVCNGETPTAGPVPKTTNAKCWNTEQDPALLEERRERLEAYAIWNEGNDQYDFYMKTYLDAIGKALNATSASEIYFNDFLLRLNPELMFIKNSTMSSSLELYKESLEISRDLKLAFDELKEHTPKWEGLEIETILNNMTESIKAVRYRTGDSGDDSGSITPEIISNNYNALGRPFNLRYEESENGNGGDNTDKLVIGKFIYLGEEPEKLGVRHFRHILNGGVRLYFKVRHPSIAPVCNSRPEGGGNTNTGQGL